MSTATPLTTIDRLARYFTQNGGHRLTPRQIRRIRHKENRSWADHAARVRFLNAGLRGEQADSEASA